MTDYLKLPEVARRLDVSEKTARRMVKSGSLPAVFIGGAYRISKEALAEYLENAKVEPGKAQAPPSPEQPNFNGLLEEERRESVYGPWLELINRYADRWEQKIAQGTLDLGAVNEFIGTLEDFGPVLRRLGLQEKQAQPAEYEYTFGPIMGEAIGRVTGLLNPLIEAGTKQFDEAEVSRLRRRREELANEQDRAASG